MRAEAVSWDDWSATNAPPVTPEDKWHVALAPGEVKVVSLEQLDDLYRLSIVDAETKVWQDGMTEWQPLRVIAGLDDAPAPEPKRTYPKPPSPRSAPPPPRPQSVAPAPLAFATTQPAFIAPVVPLVPPSIAQLTSVRPLVVSQRPMVAPRGGAFGRFLIGLSLVAGLAVCAYRNGLVREAATSVHREALFEQLESALGGPAFGTLRAVERSSAANLRAPVVSSVSANRPAESEHSAPVPAPEVAAPSTVGTPVVSLESLTPEKSRVVAAATPAAQTVVGTGTAKPRVAVKAEPVQAKPVAEKPPPAPQKPASEMTERERLNAAIGQSMLSTPSKGSKASKSKGNEYDPLNPKL